MITIVSWWNYCIPGAQAEGTQWDSADQKGTRWDTSHLRIDLILELNPHHHSRIPTERIFRSENFRIILLWSRPGGRELCEEVFHVTL
ncbi:hypothetical protein L1049_014374 [Liquidambar formosana]|uniref:Uncharacterized protein n=1 Tax=Liquidambar formosana TaxID=63359 RepID=A0AAP0WXL9_LIQFO